ncbi:2417_t:CDS:2 [Gigaspora margarita]|uniref:2417_t:CDS:1 n=1 Tax=Gigaspora margarita TaxID=4874 RepID=A0ABM8VYB7_GIGMA|nr:2417_t:CDS:2 [Gigaspora margarita]
MNENNSEPKVTEFDPKTHRKSDAYSFELDTLQVLSNLTARIV